jgi:hypothetical protein
MPAGQARADRRRGNHFPGNGPLGSPGCQTENPGRKKGPHLTGIDVLFRVAGDDCNGAGLKSVRAACGDLFAFPIRRGPGRPGMERRNYEQKFF